MPSTQLVSGGRSPSFVMAWAMRRAMWTGWPRSASYDGADHDDANAPPLRTLFAVGGNDFIDQGAGGSTSDWTEEKRRRPAKKGKKKKRKSADL